MDQAPCVFNTHNFFLLLKSRETGHEATCTVQDMLVLHVSVYIGNTCIQDYCYVDVLGSGKRHDCIVHSFISQYHLHTIVYISTTLKRCNWFGWSHFTIQSAFLNLIKLVCLGHFIVSQPATNPDQIIMLQYMYMYMYTCSYRIKGQLWRAQIRHKRQLHVYSFSSELTNILVSFLSSLL